MKNKKMWIGLGITAIIIMVLYVTTLKTDEDKVVGKWNWYNSDNEIDFSITCNEDHTGEYYLYGQTYPMDWHISDGLIYLDVRDEYGQVTIYKYSYKQDGVVLLLKDEYGESRLYLDGKPRNALEGKAEAGTYTEWSWG